MLIMVLKVKKLSSTIDAMILGIIGTTRTHATSYTELKLKMVWLITDYEPAPLVAVTMMEMRARSRKGAMM